MPAIRNQVLDQRDKRMTSIAFFADETWRGLTRQANVVFALIFKEFMGRASSSAGLLGLFWALVTPMIYALSLSTMWYFLGRHDFYGVSPFLVMTTSIMPYLLVRHSLGHIPGAIGGNMGLYGYPQVKPIDALIARFILDATLIMGGGSVLLLAMYWFADIAPSFPGPLEAIGMIALLMMMALGISLIVGIFATVSDTFDRLLGFLSRPLIIVSLVMHIGIQLPPTARYWISWNPLADINEYLRYYALGIPPMPEATIAYPALVALMMLTFGLMVYQVYRYRILRLE
jgi:capsular polysaccharide transport system permease protein